MDIPNHRETPRVARSFLVRYRGANNGQQGWLVSPLRDFSVRGARFMSERSLILGDVLELQLVLPTSPKPVALTGKVAWTKLGKLGLVEVGVVFEPVEVALQQALEKAVQRFLEK